MDVRYAYTSGGLMKTRKEAKGEICVDKGQRCKFAVWGCRENKTHKIRQSCKAGEGCVLNGGKRRGHIVISGKG